MTVIESDDTKDRYSRTPLLFRGYNDILEVYQYLFQNYIQTGKQKANIQALKDSVNELINAITQNTAWQRRNNSNDVDRSEIDTILWSIAIEASCLVLSGKLDEIDDETGEEK